ncbi:hypothetical protein HN51_053968 [Arachis hypogaea]
MVETTVEYNFSNGFNELSRIEALERERDELASKSVEKKEHIKKLTLEIEGLRRDGDEMREKAKGEGKRNKGACEVEAVEELGDGKIEIQ